MQKKKGALTLGKKYVKVYKRRALNQNIRRQNIMKKAYVQNVKIRKQEIRRERFTSIGAAKEWKTLMLAASLSRGIHIELDSHK